MVKRISGIIEYLSKLARQTYKQHKEGCIISSISDKLVGEEDILVEIERTITNGSVPSGRAAREYYASGELPTLMQMYFQQRGINKRPLQSKALGVSAQTLNKIFAGKDISENMLFRFRVARHRASLKKNYTEAQVKEILGSPWRFSEGKASELAKELSEIVSTMIERLRGSNSSKFNELQKAELISLLKELIAKLEAPFVNAEETDKAINRASTAMRRGMEKGVEEEVKKGTTQLLTVGRKYIVELVKQKGISVWTDIF